MLTIFFDTEFTGLVVDPKLISIGLVSDDEREFYAEISDTWTEKDCEDFTRQAVLPHLQGGACRMTWAECQERLVQWIEGFGEPVRLATDSLSWDWPWAQELLHNRWPANLDGKPLAIYSNGLGQYVEHVFKKDKGKTYRRHHALDDAKVNRRAWGLLMAAKRGVSS